MFSINFNPSLLGAQNNLNIANYMLNKSLHRITTGLRINSASDDPAGYYVSQGLSTQIRSLKTVQNNISIGSSLLSTAEGSLSSINTMLNRLNDLALQGASTTIDATTRNALTKEAASLVDEIKKLNNETLFNGMSVFGNMGNFSKAVVNVVPSLAAPMVHSAPVYSAPAPQNAPVVLSIPTEQQSAPVMMSLAATPQSTPMASVSTSSTPPRRLKRLL